MAGGSPATEARTAPVDESQSRVVWVFSGPMEWMAVLKAIAVWPAVAGDQGVYSPG